MALLVCHPRRTFNPEFTARYGRPTFPMKRLVKYSPKFGWARIFNFPFRGSHWRPRMHTVVLSIDGPCKVNRASDSESQAAWAVFWGPGDVKNRCGLVSQNELQTNSRAELEAVRQAVLAVRDLKFKGAFERDFLFKEIIIRLTSQYVLNALHRDVWVWVENGWQSSRDKPVAHADLILEIHSLICEMEQRMCMAVRFWKTDRDPDAKALGELAWRERKHEREYSSEEDEE